MSTEANWVRGAWCLSWPFRPNSSRLTLRRFSMTFITKWRNQGEVFESSIILRNQRQVMSNNAFELSVGQRGPRLARQCSRWPAAQLDR